MSCNASGVFHKADPLEAGSDVFVSVISVGKSWCSHALTQLVLTTFLGASYLTDPICKCHEYYRRISIVDALHPIRFPWPRSFHRGRNWDPHNKTWGGDAFCARIGNKRASGPLNLDHVMVSGARKIHTRLVSTGFDANVFRGEALSDHEGLFSTIAV